MTQDTLPTRPIPPDTPPDTPDLGPDQPMPESATGGGIPVRPVLNGDPKSTAPQKTGEIGGPKGPEPTRFGDWEVGGRCSDF